MNENNLKPFDRVLVRHDNSSYWACDLYSHYVDDNLEIHCCVGGLFSQVIPYEGNKHLLGTTDSPRPKRWRAKEGETYWFVNSNGVCFEVCDNRDKYDDDRYAIGNYFCSRAVAQAMADKFKEMLKGGEDETQTNTQADS